MIRVTAFRWVPPFAQGHVRDLRVRWALEEAGIPYQARLIGRPELTSEEYRRTQPFAQVPAYEEDGLVLFESGAIVMHIAERSGALMPPDAAGRARAKTWMFAALNSVEPPIQSYVELDAFFSGQEWAKLRRPSAKEAVKGRLTKLAAWLGARDFLEDRFTGGDLLMATVLRSLSESDLFADLPTLAAYVARCEGRPAFQKAMADHMAPFKENAPPKA